MTRSFLRRCSDDPHCIARAQTLRNASSRGIDCAQTLRDASSRGIGCARARTATLVVACVFSFGVAMGCRTQPKEEAAPKSTQASSSKKSHESPQTGKNSSGASGPSEPEGTSDSKPESTSAPNKPASASDSSKPASASQLTKSDQASVPASWKKLFERVHGWQPTGIEIDAAKKSLADLIQLGPKKKTQYGMQLRGTADGALRSATLDYDPPGSKGQPWVFIYGGFELGGEGAPKARHDAALRWLTKQFGEPTYTMEESRKTVWELSDTRDIGLILDPIDDETDKPLPGGVLFYTRVRND